MQRLANLERIARTHTLYLDNVQNTLMTLIPVFTLLKEKGVVTIEELEQEVKRLQSEQAADSGEVQPEAGRTDEGDSADG